jgi:hypothetical protein
MDLISRFKRALSGSQEAEGMGWAEQLIRTYEEEAADAATRLVVTRAAPERFDAGRRILARSRAEQVELVPVILARLKELRATYGVTWLRYAALRALLTALLRPRLPFSQEQLASIIDFYATNMEHLPGVSYRLLLRQAKQFEGGPGEHLTASMARLSDAAEPFGAHRRHLTASAERILVEANAGGPALLDSPWSAELCAAVTSLQDADRAAAQGVLARAITAGRKSKPDRASLNHARAAMAAAPELALRMLDWVESYAPDPLQRDPNEDAVRGLIWMLAAGDETAIAPRLGRYCERCFKKIPGVGAPSLKLGNAAIQTLAQLGGQHAVAELTRLKARIKYPVVVRRIEAALADVGARRGVSAEELAEMALPTYDLTRAGERRIPIGDATAIIRIAGSRDVQLTWTRPDGRETATLPKSLKDAQGDAVAAVRKLRKEIEGTLAGQASRLEALYVGGRAIPFAQWQERYLEHPLLAGLAHRLIWQFDAPGRRTDGLPRDGAIEDVAGRPIAPAGGMTVTLWHPLHAGADHVLAWRRRLATLGITQPFKQAHREIYVVTDAERETGTYSNRFAAQILRQHQFKALCDQRGWRYALMGPWDSHNTPTRLLPHHRLWAEFRVQGLESEQGGLGIYTVVATDQVRFVAESGMPIAMADVPPIVFSELMRDVDLFVGVASIGNDPSWVDGGPEQRFRAHWRHHAFGELGEAGKVRAEVLASLLPALAIADRCELQGRFLAVRGNLRSYKIHLGSANIQMAPNDQYLCIVPGRGRAEQGAVDPRIYLPFEGDMTLSIILSKAFLLAADDKITEPSIARQIRG